MFFTERERERERESPYSPKLTLPLLPCLYCHLCDTIAALDKVCEVILSSIRFSFFHIISRSYVYIYTLLCIYSFFPSCFIVSVHPARDWQAPHYSSLPLGRRARRWGNSFPLLPLSSLFALSFLSLLSLFSLSLSIYIYIYGFLKGFVRAGRHFEPIDCPYFTAKWINKLVTSK